MLFLYLTPLALLPVLFHLLLKRRRRQVPFSSFMFFMRFDARLNERRKFRELLLLVSRCLLILCVLVALARQPIGLGDMFDGLTGDAAVAIVIDNSASMSAPSQDENLSKLEVSLEGARKLIDTLEEGTLVGLTLLVDDPSARIPEKMTTDRAIIIEALDRIKPTEGTGNPTLAMGRVQALYKEAQGNITGYGAHIFTDLQRVEWAGRPIESLQGDSQTASYFADSPIVLHKIENAAPGGPNVTIESISGVADLILPNHLYPVQVAVRNDANQAAEVRLNSRNSLGETTTETLALAPNETKIVPFEMKPTAPGYYWMNFWIEGDGFAGDNRAAAGFICQPKSHVLLVGAAVEFGLLPAAISPTGEGRLTFLVPAFGTPQTLEKDLQEKAPLLIAIPWSNLQSISDPARQKLEAFVKNGGNLLLLPSTSRPSDGIPVIDWIGATPKALMNSNEGTILEPLDRRSPLWGAPPRSLRKTKNALHPRRAPLPPKAGRPRLPARPRRKLPLRHPRL